MATAHPADMVATAGSPQAAAEGTPWGTLSVISLGVTAKGLVLVTKRTSRKFPRRRFFFGDDFSCFGGGFLFDPFFNGEFSDSFGPSDSATAALAAEADGEAAEQDNPAETVGESSAVQEGSRGVLGLPEETKSEQPVTLLQLKDGSMYGLTDYWVDGQRLHYKTTYGGENSIGLDSVDLEKTAQLNADRGVVLDLQAKKR